MVEPALPQENDIVGKLFRAVCNGDLATVKEILSNAFPQKMFKNFSSTLLHQATNNSQAMVLDYLIKFGANNVDARNAQQMTPLHIASWRGDTKSIQILLLSNADVNAVDFDNRSPLYFCIYGGHYDSAKCILQDKNVDLKMARNGGWTPLHEAARFGHLKCLELLTRYFLLFG